MFNGIGEAKILRDGRIGISDEGSREIRVFEPTGEVDWVAGGPGDGPGEFAGIGRFWERANGEIDAYDWRGFRLVTFGPDGAHVETRDVDFTSAGGFQPVAGMFENGAALIRDLEGRVWGSDVPAFEAYSVPIAYALLGPEGYDTLFVSPGIEQYILLDGRTAHFGELPFGAEEIFVTGDTLAVAGVSTDPVLTVMHRDGTTDSVALPLPVRPLTPEDLARYRDRLLEDHDERVLERSSMPDRVPFYDKIRLDDEGRVWVREYEFDPTDRRWVASTFEGTAVASIVVPDSVEVHDFADGKLIGVTTDELGVERVHVWEVVR